MTKIQTSSTSPLRIDAVPVPGTTGLIGMTFCPGKKDLDLGGFWDRDLATDLEVIKDWDCWAVVTLLEPHEFPVLQVSSLPGIGRTGTIAARLLVEFGVAPEEAIQMIRRARPGTIETMAQEEYVLRLKR